MIDVRELQVIFGAGTALETCALNHVSLSIKENEFVTLIGSNGSGKSTILNAIAGEVTPQHGTISIAGRIVTRSAVHTRADQIARVFQDPLSGSCASLTVAENIALASRRGKTRRWKRATPRDVVDEFAQRLRELGLNLENRMDDRVGLLSGGQRQALCLAMATVSDCKVLLLDEHTSALDPRMASFVLDMTQRVFEAYGLTILMVTHSMRDALKCGTRTLMMQGGMIIRDIHGEQRDSLTPSELALAFEDEGTPDRARSPGNRDG